MRGIIIGTLLFGLAACGDNLGSDTPEISGATLTTDEDVPISHDVEASDPAGRALSLSAQAPMHGTVAIDRLRVTYTPGANYHGPDSFTVTVSNGTGQISARIDVTVRPVNDAPALADDAFAATEDVPLVVPHAALLANDVDVDGDPLTVSSVHGAVNGAVAITGSDVTFTPAPDFNGTASFQYTASDGVATSTATVVVTVGGENDAPVATDDTATTLEDTPVEIAAATLVANDTDVDGQTLMVTGVENATNGEVVLAGGIATFTPAPDFHGTATFEYTVSDGVATDVGVVTIDVIAVNDAPVAADDTATTLEDTPLVLSHAALLANDTDVDGPALAITAVQGAVNGTAVLGATEITFTPDAGFTGTASFDYVVSDGTDSDVGTVTITVTAIPICGDGTITLPEACDDGGVLDGDGCSAACTVEPGWSCTGQPSACTTICGDGIQAGAEACDDGNTSDGDGCSATCEIELVSIAITPGPLALGQQQRVQLTATGTYFDGTTVDLTAAAAWATTDPAVAIVGTGGADDGQVDSLTTAGTATISATVGAITGTTTVTVDAAPCSVRINEIQVAGDGAAASADEFAELVNPCTFAIDVTGWTLVYRSATGTADVSTATVALTGTMAPGSFRLYVGTGYNGGGTPDGVIGNSSTGSYAGAGGGVAVRAGPQSTGPIVDAVGWGTATNAFIEGTVAPAPPANRSLGRSPFDGKDSNDNAADFVLTDPAATPPTEPTPGATNSP
jgi:cysteine-rich repeat protein